MSDPTQPEDDLAASFLRRACLTFDNDDATRRRAAADLLAEHPHLPQTNLAVAAACADPGAVQAILVAGTSRATDRFAPFGWTPLMYQAYARHDPAIGRDATIETARLLLDAGADPDDGRLFGGLPTPFTVLTGVLGGGESDTPPHPHSLAFARLLLEAGADPNDGQALYNRMFGTDDGHLELLFEFGLGTGGDGPWFHAPGARLDPPPVMQGALLDWAVTHGQRDRVRLLAAHGVDVVSPRTSRFRAGDATPIEIALTSGHPELAQLLRESGAAEPRLNAVDSFIAAALAGDAAAAAAASPEIVTAARTARPGLVVWAASLGRPDAVSLLVGAGFDVNALGRGDTPLEQEWESALHVAAGDGNVDLVTLLLALGADPSVTDRRFGGTPLDWARHFAHPAVADVLQAGASGQPPGA